MAHEICHVEIPCKDVERIADFYRKVFGWEISPIPEMDYSLFKAGSGVGGGFNLVSDEVADKVIVYIHVDDINGSMKDIVSHGGEEVLAKTKVGDFGYLALFKDVEGNLIGLWEDLPAV